LAEPRKLGLYRTTTRTRALMMLAVDAFGYGLLGPWTLLRWWHGRRYNPESVRRIAVLRPDGIGDLVLSSPSIQALKRAFPGAEITLLVNQWARGIAEMIPGVDEIVYLEAPFFSAFKKKAHMRDILRERKRLKAIGASKRFDLALDLRGDFFSILQAFWLNARWLMARPSRAGGFLLTHRVVQPEEGRVSEIELNKDFVVIVSRSRMENDGADTPVLRLGPKVYKPDCLKALGNDYLCLAVAAPYATRCYPPQLWLRLLKLIRTRYEHPIAILGSPGEREYCHRIAEKAGSMVYNLAGRLTLAQSAACIAECRAFIGNDGGLIHIASAFRRPLIQLFGPASSRCFGHFGENEYVLQKECPYNPCAEPSCKNPHNWCMARIDPNEIMDILQDKIQLFPVKAQHPEQEREVDG